MNKRERVLKVLRNEEVDYVPGCFWRHYSPELERGEDVVQAHIKFYHETGVDFIKISSDGYFGWPAEALKDITDTKQLYDIEHIGKDHPFIRGQIERAKAIAQEMKEECCLFYTLFCPLSLFRLEVGWDKMMECMRKDPKAVMHVCDVIAEDVNLLVEGLFQEAGVDGLFYSVQNAEMTRFTMEEYQAWVEPSDRKVLEFANTLGSYNILHCCGWDADESGTYNHLESWKDYPCAAVSWAAYVDQKDITEIREFFGGKPCWGGFDNRACGMMYGGTEAEIREETKRLVSMGGKKGYILGPDCSLPNDIDNDHIRWVVETSKSM